MNASKALLIVGGLSNILLVYSRAHAESISVTEPISFDAPLDITADNELSDSADFNKVSLPSATNLSKDEKKQSVQANEYSNQDIINTLEDAITEAITSHDWQSLDTLLVQYKAQADHDALLYYYGLGALYRSQRQHYKAILAYQTLLNSDPSLIYPRFDLGVMLFENKQYKQAEQVLSSVKSQLSPDMQKFANAYLQQINQRQSWQADVSFNYERTDNVNNASNAKTINWRGIEWKKTEDSLPKSAQGIRYGLSADKDVNVSGNHFVTTNTSLDGVHYWDNIDYNEQSLRLRSGYKYQDINHSFSLMPFVERNRLGGENYNKSFGINASSNKRLTEDWRGAIHLGYNKKSYDETPIAQKYNGYTLSSSGSLIYLPTPQWLLYAGGNWSYEKTQDAEKSSIRRGVSLGTTRLFDNGLGARINMNYTQREFDAPGTIVYRFIRKDNEYRIGSEVWHKNIAYKGFEPHLNISYLNVDSNMDGLYSRDNVQWFLSINKSF